MVALTAAKFNTKLFKVTAPVVPLEHPTTEIALPTTTAVGFTAVKYKTNDSVKVG